MKAIIAAIFVFGVTACSIVAGCAPSFGCTEFGASFRNSSPEEIALRLDAITSRQQAMALTTCILDSTPEHPDTAIAPLLAGLRLSCARWVLNELADSAKTIGARRLVVLAALFRSRSSNRCSDRDQPTLSKRIVDVTAAMLLDTGAIASARWRGHAGTDHGLTQYGDLALLAMDGLVFGLVGAVSDSLGLARYAPEDKAELRKHVASEWSEGRERAQWNEKFNGFLLSPSSEN